MTGITIYDDEDFFELLDSVRATAKTARTGFTADEMLSALEAAADPSKEGNDLINSNRIRATLSTLSTHVGQFFLVEANGTYTVR